MSKVTAECVIQWKDTNEKEHVLISLDGHDNDQIFFVCLSEQEFLELYKTDGFGDFEVLSFKY